MVKIVKCLCIFYNHLKLHKPPYSNLFLHFSPLLCLYFSQMVLHHRIQASLSSQAQVSSSLLPIHLIRNTWHISLTLCSFKTSSAS